MENNKSAKKELPMARFVDEIIKKGNSFKRKTL
jgi:hypothetical protein